MLIDIKVNIPKVKYKILAIYTDLNSVKQEFYSLQKEIKV